MNAARSRARDLVRKLRDSKAYAFSNTDLREIFILLRDVKTQNRELSSELNRVSFGGIS